MRISKRRFIIVSPLMISLVLISLIILINPVNASINSNTGMTNGFSSPAYLYVVRMTSLSNPSESSEYPTVDNQHVAKYPPLQNAIKDADKWYGIYESACVYKKCLPTSLPPPWEGHNKVITISSQEANAIISEEGFNFHKFSLKLYASHFKIGNAIYTITLSSADK